MKLLLTGIGFGCTSYCQSPLISMEPSWDLAIPSPLRLENLCEGVVGDDGDNSRASIANPTGRILLGSVHNSLSIIDPITPICLKRGADDNDQSPQSTNMPVKRSNSISQNAPASLESDMSTGLGTYTAMQKRLDQAIEIPKVFVRTKNCSSADLHELGASVIATIEKNRETYICWHDVSDYVARKVGDSRLNVKWKHLDDRTFLFALQESVVRETFLQSNKRVLIGDAPVSFKPWRPFSGTVKKPCRFKVWLRLTGLPIEHFCFNTAERVVCSFGRLYKCNLEKKETYLGAFYIMIDCPDIDDIKPTVLIQTDTDSEEPIFVNKLYSCKLDVYNDQKFAESVSYDVLSMLISRNSVLLVVTDR